MTTEKEFPEIIGRYFEGFCPICSNPAPFVGENFNPLISSMNVISAICGSSWIRINRKLFTLQKFQKP